MAELVENLKVRLKALIDPTASPKSLEIFVHHRKATLMNTVFQNMQ